MIPRANLSESMRIAPVVINGPTTKPSTITPTTINGPTTRPSQYTNPFGNIAYSSTSEYDDLFGTHTDKWNKLRGIGSSGEMSYGPGADNAAPPMDESSTRISNTVRDSLPSLSGSPQGDGANPMDNLGSARMFGKAFGTPQSNTYTDMIMESLAGAGWTEKQRKYARRHGNYLGDAAKQLGTHFTKVEVPKGYEGTAYVVTAADGKRYIIDAPHSPGGNLLDIDLGEGATSLGLGGLGGSGEYKNIPGNAGASYIAFDDYKGPAPKVNHYTDINIKEQSPLGMMAGMVLSAVGAPYLSGLMTPSMGALGANIAASALTGGVGSALSGGDPLKGALMGGISGGLTQGMSGWNPTDSALANSAIKGAITGSAKGLVTGDPLQGALTGGISGGLNQYLNANLPSNLKWAASPVSSIGTQLATKGKVNPYAVIQQWGSALNRPQTNSRSRT
jgi:hypothetical protein